MVESGLRILVVDDNEGCRELYTLWLGSANTVIPAKNGHEAMDHLDETVDIVLLDRDMPGPSGIEVAQSIEESSTDAHVVMVSSMAPDFDIVECPIDGYLQKPVEGDEIQGVVDRYRSQQAYRAALDEFFSLSAKLAALEAGRSSDELERSEEYARLEDRVASKREEVNDALATARADWVGTFKQCAESIPAEIDLAGD